MVNVASMVQRGCCRW